MLEGLLEAINSDPMLGFFSEPIKIYFLIWSVAHFMSRYRRVCGSNGGHRCSFRVDQLVCRFSTFFSAHQENQTILFLELLVQYQACRLLKSTIAGEHFFFYQNRSENHVLWKYNLLNTSVWHTIFLVVCWQTGISVLIIFAWKFSTIVQFLEKSGAPIVLNYRA